MSLQFLITAFIAVTAPGTAEFWAGFMAMTFIVFALCGGFAASARERLLASEPAMRWLNRGVAAIFAALGARLALVKA